MTEEEARTKWCPMVRIAASETYIMDNRGHSNINGLQGSSKCMASKCMLWEENTMTYSEANECINNGFYPEENGYCGLSRG